MSSVHSIGKNQAGIIVDFTIRNKRGDMLTLAKESYTSSHIVSGIRKFKKFYSKTLRFFKKHFGKDPIATSIPPTEIFSMRGAGVKYKNTTYITHTSLPFSLSALRTFNQYQKIAIALFSVFSLIGFVIVPISAFKVLVTVLSLMYFSDVLFNLIIVARSLNFAKDVSFTKDELAAIDESKLPIYTVLCPLYKEAHVFPQFLSAINKLDYPKDKLDILLLLEEDDTETIKILDKLTLPFYIKKIIVPNSLPKTKPKACNYGLSYAKGKYLVIYDAEDIPDPLQLKKAYLGFQTLPREVQCLQAKLSYYNPRANLLTRFFTVEYALWFDIMLTGLQSFNSTLPLGGTSNHFKTAQLRRLQGWDPFNVTEDADLGVRLFQKGFRTAVIDSTTHEEATSQLKNWIRQRSRWLKGYMQTYFVHTRNYKDFITQKGILHYIVFQLTVGGKVLFILINPMMWLITLLYFATYSFAGPFLETIYTPPISYIAVTSWIFGNFLFVYYYMIACGRKKEWDLMKYVLLIPIYWGMMSYAGAIALYQLILKPHYWEKTVHGMHLVRKQRKHSAAKSLHPAPSFMPNLNFAFQSIISVKNSILSFIYLFKSYDFISGNKGERSILIYNWRDTKHVYAGGAEVYIQELAKRWVENGATVTIFCGSDYKNKLDETIDGVNILRRGGTYTVYLFGFLYYILKFRGKAGLIIDCENGIPFFSPLFAKIPVILLIHHVHQEVFREFLRTPMRQIAAYLEGTLMPMVYRKNQIVTVSNSSMAEILKMGFAKPNNIRIIPNGVRRTLESIAYEKTINPSLMYLGRLKSYKNVDIAIKAFAKIAHKYPDAVFSIVGTGETYPKLHKLVKRLNLENQIHFLGHITEEVKHQMLSESWFVVQPSQIEGWGITVLEANMCKTPVIASRVNGLIDSVVDKKTGLLVTCKNVDEFANAMQLMIENETLRVTLSENAYYWSRNFNWDDSAKRFETLIDDKLHEKKGMRPAVSALALSTK
jgi:glycosyltransferase XagB